jgi:polar amino acid transport system permease protein
MTSLRSARESRRDAMPAEQATVPRPPRIVPARNWGARLLAAAILLVLAGFVLAVVTGGGVQWAEIPPYLFDPTILSGVQLTLLFTLLSMGLSLVGGVVVAMLRMSSNPVLSGLARLYIWFFRGTPLLVQIIFWFNIQLFIPRLAIGPWSVETNQVVSAFTAALLALTLNETAYMAEIVRGGLLSVDRGQAEAALALGYTPGQSLRRIILPQAIRVTIPSIGNQTISMLKTTSLVSVVAAQDLLTRAQNIYARNFLIIELLIVASVWYLVMTTIASGLQLIVERRLSRSLGADARGWLFRRRATLVQDGNHG